MYEIVNIDIEKISDFKNHPFRVVNDDKMQELVQSIKQSGVLMPAIVRPKEDGTYEMVSGHRRKLASILADLKQIPCIIRELTDEEATILMVDSNMNQREDILPSEKARAYKMKLDAIKHQGERTDLKGKNRMEELIQLINGEKNITSTPMEPKLRTNEQVGLENSESREQVRRYIRLNYLIPELLDMVDENKIGFRPAVEISYLSEENQNILFNAMSYTLSTPSLAQAIKLKLYEKENKLNVDLIQEVLNQDKPNQVEKIKLNAKRFENVFPKSIKSNQEREDFIFMCIEEHNERLKKRDKER